MANLEKTRDPSRAKYLVKRALRYTVVFEYLTILHQAVIPIILPGYDSSCRIYVGDHIQE